MLLFSRNLYNIHFLSGSCSYYWLEWLCLYTQNDNIIISCDVELVDEPWIVLRHVTLIMGSTYIYVFPPGTLDVAITLLQA